MVANFEFVDSKMRCSKKSMKFDEGRVALPTFFMMS
jgi:hypothetical protein